MPCPVCKLKNETELIYYGVIEKKYRYNKCKTIYCVQIKKDKEK